MFIFNFFEGRELFVKDDPQTERGGRTSCHTLTPAQGLERGRDGGEEKVMTVTRA